MPPRFYCPELVGPGPATLTEVEAHHAAHVLRLKVGESLELFNGRGVVGSSVIERIQKQAVFCDVRNVVQEAVPAPEIILATAVPKGERFDWLVEKATELGVARLTPLVMEHSSVDPRESKLDRLRQTIIAACKQCRRSHLMQLDPVTTWEAFLNGIEGGRLLVAHRTGAPLADVLADQAFQSMSGWTLAIGPEGGFTEGEISDAVQHGGRLVNLGPHPLRVETAGLVAAAWGLIQQSAISISR